MTEPMSILSSVGASITATVTFSNLVLGLRNCPDEAKTCFSLVKLVHADIQYAVALRTKHRAVLLLRPADAKRIDDILNSASQSLDSIGSLVERLNPNAHGGKIPYPKRLRWFLGDSTSFALRTRNLQAQHAAVQGEICWLRMVELVAPLHSVAETKTSFDNFDLWKRRHNDDYDDKDDGRGTGSVLLRRRNLQNSVADKHILDTNQPFLSPCSSAGNVLQRNLSAQTLAGSDGDVSHNQLGEYVNQRVQNAWGLNRDYSDGGCYVELPASSTFGESGSSSTMLTGTSEGCEDDIGSFFRAWREDQAERRQQSAGSV